jgi:hypothetical protein
VRASAAIVFLGATLLCIGCGGSRLSESALRAKANGICTKLNGQTESVKIPTRHALEAGIAAVQSGITQLARLRPPARDEATYTDFLARLRSGLAFIKAKGPQLVALEQALEKTMPRRIGDYGPGLAFHRLSQVAGRETTLVRPLEQDVRIAANDARALHLGSCASGITGG